MPRIMSHHHTITDSERALVEEKIARLRKFFDRIVEVSIILDETKNHCEAEILLWGPQLNLRVKDQATDMRTAFEGALNKAEHALRKNKTRRFGDKMHRRRNLTIRKITPAEGTEVTTAPQPAASALSAGITDMKPMSPDEARLQMQALDAHLLVFVNSETDQINVLHQSNNGHLELVEVSEEEAFSLVEGNPDAAIA